MKYNIVKGINKGTIVFIHGNSSSSTVFDEIMKSETITQTKIAVDLPGHGSNLDGYIYDDDFSVISYRKKLIAFINTIDDDILMAGNSLGGHLAIEIAEDINRLKGLVIFGTPPLKKPINLEDAFLPVEALQTFFTENPANEEIESSVNVTVFNKELAYKIVEDFKKSNPKVRKAIVNDISQNSFLDQFKIFTNLKIRKYIIAGSHDPSVNPEYLKIVADACHGNCELIHFENCGHYASLEKPNEFVQTINLIGSKVFK